MSAPAAPEPSMLILGVLLAADMDGSEVLDALSARFGTVEKNSGFAPFIQTKYYQKEMGEGIRRGYVSIAGRVAADGLPGIKLGTNELEKRWMVEGRRLVNLDPGLLDLNRMVLASGKNVGHRVYLGEGIFGELEYVFQGGSFTTLPWTYPDYAEPHVVGFFNSLREDFKRVRALELSTVASKGG